MSPLECTRGGKGSAFLYKFSLSTLELRTDLRLQVDGTIALYFWVLISSLQSTTLGQLKTSVGWESIMAAKKSEIAMAHARSVHKTSLLTGGPGTSQRLYFWLPYAAFSWTRFQFSATHFSIFKRTAPPWSELPHQKYDVSFFLNSLIKASACSPQLLCLLRGFLSVRRK